MLLKRNYCKNYSTGTAFKTMHYWQNDGQIDQRARRENAEAEKTRAESPL